MYNDDELILWGTIRGWSKKLGIPEGILRERCKNLPMQLCQIRDPNNPEVMVAAQSFPESDVMEACADLLRPTMVDTEDLVAKDIRKEIMKEKEHP